MATKDDSDIPESGAVFTFGKSKFADNTPNKFWVKNDKVLQIACGDEHTALVTESGRIFMFGPNDWGQLGVGNDNKMATKPSCIKSLKHDKSKLVACGRSHTLVSTALGHVYSFGSNSEGQLGIKDVNDLSTPKRIESLSEEEFKMLDAGSDSSVALTEDGRVYVWGGNEDGKLGLGDVDNADEPTLLAMERPAVCIACGYYHTAVVLDDGKLYTMGEAEGGKLGLPEELEETTNIPQQVTEIPDPVSWVACGSSHTVALTNSGEVYVFGEGESGQLGLGTDILSIRKPTLLKLPFKVSRVFCGQAFTACISEKGQLYTFGDGRHGKLAHGCDVFSNQFKPFHSKRFSKFLVDKVSCGGCHMIVTARPKALNGVEDDDNEDVDEMMKEQKSVSQPTESSGSPSLTRTLSARERRRDEVSRSFSSLNQTLPSLGQSRILPSLSATMPALKSTPKDTPEDIIKNGIVPQLQNGKMSDVDSANDTEEEDNLQQKHKKLIKVSTPKASPRKLQQKHQQQEFKKPPKSPRRVVTPRSSTGLGSLPPVQIDEDGDGKKAHGSGSDGDMENEEEDKDGSHKKKKKSKKRKTSKAEEEEEKLQEEDKGDDSWNDDSDEDDKVNKENLKSLQLALENGDDDKSDKDEKDGDSAKESEKDKESEKEDKEEVKKSDKESEKEDEKDKESEDEGKEKMRGPIPVPRKQKHEESEDNEEDGSEKEDKKDLKKEDDSEKEEENDEEEVKELEVDEKTSDLEDEKKDKKGKKDKDKNMKEKDKKKKKDDDDEEGESINEEKEKEKDEKEEEEEGDSKSKDKDKKKDKKDKKDKKKDKEKDKKKKKGKGDEEDEEDEEEESGKKSKDKKKDKKDKKKDKDKDKDKGGEGDKDEEEKEEEDEQEDEKDDKKKKKDKKDKDKDKKQKDKKKKDKDDADEKDVNGNTEKPPPKKSRTCTIL